MLHVNCACIESQSIARGVNPCCLSVMVRKWVNLTIPSVRDYDKKTDFDVEIEVS